jgi:hypothetical protein
MNNPYIVEKVREGMRKHEAQQRANQRASQQPDAPGCEGLAPEARKNAAELYGQHVMSQPAGSLDDNALAFLKASIAATLREMS